MSNAGPSIDDVTEEVLRLANEAAMRLRGGGSFAALSSLAALAPAVNLLTQILSVEVSHASSAASDRERRNPVGFPVPGRNDG